MAQQSVRVGAVEWKPGTTYDFYDRNTRKWVEAEVIGSFSDDDGEWIKVRCGQKDHDVMKGDPDLRKRAVIPGHQLKQLQDVAAQMPNIAPILESILPSSSGQGLYAHSDERMTWFKVVNCVNNELFPVLSIALRKCIDEKLSDDNNFKPHKFDEDVVDDIMERLKGERTMNNKEMKYLKELFQRAVDSAEKKRDSGATSNVSEMCKDISPEWSGMTVDILYDIFGVHKALVFGRLQRADYSPTEFMNDIKSAENKVFKQNICSHHLLKEDPRLALSFYPEFMINDDLFEVMAYHFAVSSVVREMGKTSEDLHIYSVVVPVAICSRYDVDVRYQPTIANLDVYLQQLATSGFCYSRRIDFEVANVLKMAKIIKSLLSLLNVNNDNSQCIAIIFHRERADEVVQSRISVFGCDDSFKMSKLYRNYFISFDFHTLSARVISSDATSTVVRCWINFGVGQRLRFYPEYSVWIIPQLFIRSTKMTAHKFLERIYGDEYKHGWRVSLDDPVFNRYYHIITEHEHVSNNYDRTEVEVKQRDVQKLLRDHLDEKLRWETAVKVTQFVGVHAYDSEAILEDMEDVKDSNIMELGNMESDDRSNLKFAVLRFQNMECKKDSVSELSDCEHVHILIENLRKFQDCALVVDALNVIQFDVDSIITAFDHIIKVHGFLSDSETKLQIQQYFADQVACRVGAGCAILRLHGERIRERENVEEKRDEPVDEVDTLCEVTADALNSVHCYVLHQKTDLYRMLSGRDNDYSSRFSTAVNDDEQMEDTEEMKDDGVAEEIQSQGINFGLNILQWLPFGEEPEFDTLGEEMVENPDSTIDAHIFQQYLMICLAKITGTNYTVNEMVSLKFYTDTNEMQSQLRKAHWTAASSKVRKSYYQWAMGLYRAHLYHDKPIPTATGSTTKPCRLYHGLNQLFTVSREMPVYFGPFSTTIARTVATTFCNEQGLIWLIQSSYVNPLKIVVGINVDWISGFKHEREVLLYNQCLPIQETETFDDNSDILMNHLVGSLISRESPIIKKEAFYKQLGIGVDATWLHTICDHKQLFEKTACKEMRVVDRVVTELNMVGPNTAVKLWNTKRGDKSELEHFVEDSKATQLSEHYKVLTSKFKVLHFSDLLNWSWLQFSGNTNDDCIKETKYKINSKSIMPTTSSVQGQVTKIQVKNSRLFGHRFVNLQTFNDEHDNKGDSCNIVDYVRLDRYGFLFVNDVPKKDHVFAMGDVVQCEDGSVGKICDLTANRICVEIGDEKRWIERSIVPSQVTLYFHRQQDIGKYEFVINRGEDVAPPEQCDTLSFSEVSAFEIPYLAVRDHRTDAISIKMYVKPKGTNLPLTMIKCIEIRPNDVDDHLIAAADLKVMNTESTVNSLMMTLKERDSEIWNNVAFLNTFGLSVEQQSEWMKYIDEHALLFAVTSYRRKLVVERLIVELNLLSTDWVHKFLEQTMEDKPMLEWLVNDRKLIMLSDHLAVLKAKFEVLHFSALLNRSWLRFTNDPESDYIKESEYQTEMENITATTSSVQGQVTSIQVKNLKLFGEHFVNLQTFDSEDEHKGAASDFVDYLGMDRYGFVFVGDIPKKDHKFKLGDVVKCSDDSLGKISEVKHDKICVEIGDERQWIDRKLAPISLTLIFPNQQDIAKYEFVLDADNAGTSREQLSDARTFSFSDVARFEIPYSSMRNSKSDAVQYNIYAKPTGTDIPLIKIKSIQYPPADTIEFGNSVPSFSNENTESIVTHLLMKLKERDSEIRDERAFLKSLGLEWDDHLGWMECIADHSMLFDATSYRRKLIIERLIVEVNLLSVEWVRRITKQTKNDKPLLEWLVEDRKILRLMDHYRFMTSKFKILHFSQLLNRSWLKLEINNKMKEVDLENDHSSFKETEYKVNGQIFAETSFCVKGQVSRIEVKNLKLFGKHFADLQRFEDAQEQKGNPDEFVDALAVDRYGFVFVNDVATENGNSEFAHQQDIGKYEFVVSAEVEDGAPNLSKARKFTFSDIKQFEIPCSSMSDHISHDVSVAVYVKPKGIDVPLIMIKSIVYSPNDVDEVVISNTESMVNHLMATVKGTRTEIRDETNFLNSLGLHTDDQSKWMHLIFEHSMLFEVSQYRGKLVIERLIVELNLLCTDWLHAILNQKKESKPLLEWLVEERKVFRLLDHYRVITSKFEIVNCSKLMNCSWLRLRKNTKMDKTFGHEPRVKEAEYFVNGQIPISLNGSINGVARNISFRNSDLFGDCKLTLQRFDHNHNGQDTATTTDFVNSLEIDKCGVISVNIGIGRNVEVNLNGQWIKGVISRMDEQNICVRTGSHVLSFHWIQKEHISTRIKCLSFESEWEISEYEFAARAGEKHDGADKSNLKPLIFNNVKEFRISMDLLTAKSITPNAVHIYAKPKKNLVDYHHIKTVHCGLESWCFPRYMLEQEEVVCIDRVFAVKPFLESAKFGGELQVVTSSGISISNSGVINASGCGLKQDSQYSNDQSLKFGQLVDNPQRGVASKTSSKSVGAGGGIVSLFAAGNVVNEGAVLCNASEENVFSGGSVVVDTDGVFENKGKIDCGEDGKVRIECGQFINSGLITPRPNVVIRTKDSMALYRNGIVNGKEELIKLEVVDHRGHYSSYHIQNVLKEGKDKEYWCKNQGPPNEDWFIFRVQSKQSIIPKSIVIMNNATDHALKTIAIAGSNDEFGHEFVDWIQLNDIQKSKNYGTDDRQKFQVDQAAAFLWCKRGFDTFRIEVLENYGRGCNAFKEFMLYGICCE